MTYKGIFFLYVPSSCSSLSWLLLISFTWDFLLIWDYYNAWLQLLFIGFYNTTPIWSMRWSWSLDVWKILVNPIRSWSPWSRRILDPLIFRTRLHWIGIESYLYSTRKENLHLKRKLIHALENAWLVDLSCRLLD